MINGELTKACIIMDVAKLQLTINKQCVEDIVLERNEDDKL